MIGKGVMEMFIWQTNDYTSCTNSTNFRRTGVVFATRGEKVINIEKGGNIEKKELYTKL